MRTPDKIGRPTKSSCKRTETMVHSTSQPAGEIKSFNVVITATYSKTTSKHDTVTKFINFRVGVLSFVSESANIRPH